jgi:hypothetical protein
MSRNKINHLISSLSIRADLSVLTSVHLHPDLLASSPVMAVPCMLVAVVPVVAARGLWRDRGGASPTPGADRTVGGGGRSSPLLLPHCGGGVFRVLAGVRRLPRRCGR